MYAYLTAGADKKYDSSAYSFIIGNFPIQYDRKLGWTVVEAYLNGFVQLSNFIVKKHLYVPVRKFTLCTASQPVIKLLTTDYLDKIKENNWKSLDGKYLFHLHLLKEIYLHKIYYKERDVEWEVLTELDEMHYGQFEICQEQVNSLVGGN